MTKRDVAKNPIAYDALMEIAKASGLRTKDLASYTQIMGPNGQGSIYVARNKRVTRVDVSGFVVEHEGLTQVSREEAKELRLGKVSAQVDFTRDEATATSAFKAALHALASVPGKPAPEPKAERPHRARASTADGMTEVQASADEPVA